MTQALTIEVSLVSAPEALQASSTVMSRSSGGAQTCFPCSQGALLAFFPLPVKFFASLNVTCLKG